MFDRVDTTARSYFQGLLKLTAIDTVCIGLGVDHRGAECARSGSGGSSAQLDPVVGVATGCILVVLVAATERPADAWIVYNTVGVFLSARLLDNFFFIPATVGRSIQMHPLPTVVMVAIGGAVAGIPGLILAVAAGRRGECRGVGTVGGIVQDPRLRARHASPDVSAQRISADFQGHTPSHDRAPRVRIGVGAVLLRNRRKSMLTTWSTDGQDETKGI